MPLEDDFRQAITSIYLIARQLKIGRVTSSLLEKNVKLYVIYLWIFLVICSATVKR